MKRRIIYVGGFRLPDVTASAQRAMENANLFRSVGYEVVLVGKLDGVQAGDAYRDIRAPFNGRPYRSYTVSSESVWDVVRHVGPATVHSVIAYNYPSIALRSIIRRCAEARIGAIAECTEWYGFEGPSLAHNVRRVAGSAYRIRVLTRRAGNVICASRYLESRLEGVNALRLPFVVDADAPKWQKSEPPAGHDRRRFVYVGSPGVGMAKDLVHDVIRAFADVRLAGLPFELVIVGFREADLLEYHPSLRTELEQLRGAVRFLGRIPHNEALAQLKSADFSVFLRPRNRVSEVGFPTKYVEAVTCGVPTITNRTSDLGLYLQDGRNGYLLDTPHVEELTRKLKSAIELDTSALAAMKQRCRQDNPFHYALHREAAEAFLGRVEERAAGAG